MKTQYLKTLSNPKWQKRRLEILNRDKWKCSECGDTKNELHVHHKIYRFGKEIWDYKDHELTTLCKKCHDEETRISKILKEMINDFRCEFPSYEVYSILYSILNSRMDAQSVSEIIEQSLSNYKKV